MYGKYLYIDFTNFAGESCTVEIYKRDFSGDAIERDGLASPITIQYGDGGNETFATVMGSKAVVSFYSETPDEFEALYVTDKREYYCILKRNTFTPQYLWRGWIVPEQRNEKLTYKAPVQLTFMCGLGELKNMAYDNNGVAYGGRKSYIEIISTILDKLETGLDINVQVGYAKYGDGFTRTFENMFVEAGIYAGMNCREVLDQLLVNCRLMQSWGNDYGGFWFIQGYSYIHSFDIGAGLTDVSMVKSVDIYGSDGAYLYARDFDYLATVDNALIYHTSEIGLGNWSAWDRMNFIQKLSLVGNYINNTDFNTDEGLAYTDMVHKTLSIGDGTKALRMPGAGYPSSYVEMDSVPVSANSGARLKLSFKWNLYDNNDTIDKLDLGLMFYRVELVDPEGAIATRHGVLSTNTETGEKHISFESGTATDISLSYYEKRNDPLPMSREPNVIVPKPLSEATALNEYSVLIVGIPFTGVIRLRFYKPKAGAWRISPNDYGDSLLNDLLTAAWAAPKLEMVDAIDNLFETERTKVIVNSIRHLENGDDFELLQGDLPADVVGRETIWNSAITSTDSFLDLIDDWHAQFFTLRCTYAELMARLRFFQHGTPALSLDATLANEHTMLPPHTVYMDINGDSVNHTRFFVFNSLTLDCADVITSGTMVSVLGSYYNVAINEMPIERQKSGGNNSGTAAQFSHPPVALAEDSFPELELEVETQVLRLDLSTYAKTSDLHERVTIVTGSEQYLSIDVGGDQRLMFDPSGLMKAEDAHPPVYLATEHAPELTLNDETQMLDLDLSQYAKLDDVIDTFIDLTDTPAAYSNDGKGKVLIEGADSVVFSSGLGVDGDGVWAYAGEPITEYYEKLAHPLFDANQTGWTIGNDWVWEDYWPAIWADETDAPTASNVSQSLTLVAGVTYKFEMMIWLSSGTMNVKVNGVLVKVLTAGVAYFRTEVFYYTAATGGVQTLLMEFVGVSTSIRLHMISVKSQILSGGKGFRLVDGAGADVYSLPTQAPELNSIMLMNADKQGIWYNANWMISAGQGGVPYYTDANGWKVLSHGLGGQIFAINPATFAPEWIDPVTGLPAGTNGDIAYFDGTWKVLHKGTDGNFIKQVAGLPAWGVETSHADVLQDGDFTSDGIMTRSGAGTYAMLANNAALWNTLAASGCGTKGFWNGAAGSLPGTRDANTIYFVNI